MIWLTWRQHRTSLVVAGILLAGATVFLILTGLALAEPIAALTACRVTHEHCNTPDSLSSALGGLAFLISLFDFLPLCVGVFWGAPLLAREFEQGTHRVAWTQGVSRRGWLVTKLGVLAVAALALGLTTGALFSWWFPPVAEVYPYPPLATPRFDLSGIVPAGYAVFGLALGVAVGALLKRTVPAMAVTVVAFIAVRIGVLQWRHYYQQPLELRHGLGTDEGQFADARQRPVRVRGR